MPTAIESESFFELPYPRAAVWRIFRQTDWLNRSLGLPPVTYRFEPLAEGGVAVQASARMAGINLNWREWPFEWTEPEFYSIRREFASGALIEGTGGVELHELPGNRTRLRFYSRLVPRNLPGRWLAKAVLAPKTTRDLVRIAAHVEKSLRAGARHPLPKLPVSPVNETALRERAAGLQKSGCDVADVARLVEWLRSAPDVELTHIRPKALARAWDSDMWATLKLLLFAVQSGLLQFRWEVLCPNCRSSRAPRTTSLTMLKSESHCDVCQIRFDGEFDKSVELKFSVHPAVRPAPDQTFCLVGPGGTPHVRQQFLLRPGEIRDWKWPADSAGLRLRSPQVKEPRMCEELAVRRSGRIECRPEGFHVTAGGGAGGWRIANPNPFAVQAALERVAWGDDILTAATATNWQVFRDLFAAEVISPGEQVTVGEQAILFTDLRGSTAMYHALGDARAYRYVRDHFSVLAAAVGGHHGGIVKTIGDAVMAVFGSCTDAFAAAESMFAGIAAANQKSPDRQQLVLKAGLHAGSCLAVNANGRLDYFGTTVNLAARLVDLSRGGELTVSDDTFNRAEMRERFGGRLSQAKPGQFVPRGFAGPIDIWLVPME